LKSNHDVALEERQTGKRNAEQQGRRATVRNGSKARVNAG